MPTCKCGKTVSNMRAARGHVQFTTDEDGPHGPHGEVPDGWTDLFDDLDDEQDADADDLDDEQDETQREPDADDSSDDPRDEPDGSTSTGSRLKRAVTDDIRHLWRTDL